MNRNILLHFVITSGLILLSCISGSLGELEVVWAQAERLDLELVWRPELQSSDYFVLGHYVNRTVESRNGNIELANCYEQRCWDKRIPVARATGDELAVPLSFKHVLTYKNLHFWNMECTIGYAALSGVATLNIFGLSSLSFPDDTDRYRCVHKNFTERKELYYHFYGNGLNGIWAMPVTNLSVGSFFALSEPDRVTSSAFAYQLTSQIKEMNLQEKIKTPEVAALKQRQQQQGSTPLKSFSTSYTSSPNTPSISSRNLTIVIASAAVISSSLVASVVLLVYCLRHQRQVKARKQETSSNDITPEFVFRASTRASRAGKQVNPEDPLDDERVMRINMLYGHRL